MIALWQHILAKIQTGQKVYLLTTIHNQGSSPGRQGFKMMVAEDGFIYGSIGGGVMEYNLVEEARRALRGDDLKIYLKKQVHRGGKEDSSGMICSGEQTVVFHPLGQIQSNTVQKIIEALQNNKRGTLRLSHHGIDYDHHTLKRKFECTISSPHEWMYGEAIGFKNAIFIIGGGHVSLAVSDVFSKLGFHVSVLDDRDQVNTFGDNNFAHRKVQVSYKDIAKHLPEGKNHYVVIMTNTFVDDKLVLGQLIRSNYGYLGVLGSRSKIATMRKVMLAEGFSEAELDKVHAPIGLPINSETPYEIAISIAAQLIGLMNKK